MRQELIRAISVSELFDDPRFPGLVEEYAAECALPEIGAINPQQAHYQKLERLQALQIFAAYDDALIGFAFVLVYSLPHYGKQVASVESIFVDPLSRNSGTGRKLMRAAEEYARTRSCQSIGYSAPAGSRFAQLLTLLARRKQYRNTNLIFMRSLA